MTYYKVYSSVVATGTHCYIYVENGLSISAASTDAVRDEFDTKIYPTITGRFGSEPNPGLDGDSRIYILLLNIRDGFDQVVSPSYVAGYFDPGNQLTASENSKSNVKEMFFMNANPALHLSLSGLYGTLAHEFQHMIHWEQKTNLRGFDDDIWLNEAMSEVAPTYLYGPNYGRVFIYEQAPSDSLTIWNDTVYDYGIAYMWSQYFKDRFDPGNTGAIFSGIMQQNSTGITSVNSALATLAPGKTFASTFNDMAIAIFSGNTLNWGGRPEWSYTSIDTQAGVYSGITLPGLLTADNQNKSTLPVLGMGSVGFHWYTTTLPIGDFKWIDSSGAMANFIDYGRGWIDADIVSGATYTFDTRGILIVSTPSATASGSVVYHSPSSGSPVLTTPKQMLSKANIYAAKHNKHQGICVHSFFVEREKDFREKGIRPNF